VRAPRWLPGAAALLAIAALPLTAERLRSRTERCEVDGVAVAPAFRVRVVEPDGTTHVFCGVTCARSWLSRRGREPRAVLVTDCASGRETLAEEATFVRTVSTWSDGAPDFIRVFARPEDAERHVAAYGGRILTGADRPFGGGGEEHATENR
jgi:hypothetical protein